VAAHPGQDGPDQRGRAEEVGGEQLLDLILGRLDGGAVAVAGVVDQDIDGAEAFLGGVELA